MSALRSPRPPAPPPGGPSPTPTSSPPSTPPVPRPRHTDLPDNVQLTAYSDAYQLLFGRPPKEPRLVNLVRTKAPLVESHTTGRDAVDLFHLGREVRRGIEAGVFIPNRGCWMCRDCEYEQDCRDWTGNDDRRELRT